MCGGGGSEDSVAFGRAEAGEGEARNAAGLSRKFGCVSARSDDSWYLLQDCLADGLGDDGRDDRVRDARCSSCMSDG